MEISVSMATYMAKATYLKWLNAENRKYRLYLPKKVRWEFARKMIPLLPPG